MSTVHGTRYTVHGAQDLCASSRQIPELSAIVITRNEARHIGECLETLHFCGEIIVVDSGSTDQTVSIARKYTEKVFETEWMGYAEAKQFACDKASGEWILWIDADERVPDALAFEIREILKSGPKYAGYKIARRAFFLRRWIKHGGWYPGYVTRLFRRNAGRFDSARVHESLILTGSVGTLKNDLLHFTDESIYHYFEKFNKYTSLAADDLAGKCKMVGIADLLFRPPVMFLKMYILKFGFWDGIEGFLLAIFSSHYVFVKYAKLWERRNSEGVRDG